MMPLKETDYSIIIPCYNADEFVSRAIDSAIMQTIDNYEIILVNDGSTDGTADLLESYKLKYKDLIHCVHQKNSGAAAARNAGMRVSKGRYLLFFDADDQLCSNALAIFDNYLKSTDCRCDYLYAGYYYVEINGRIKKLSPKPGKVNNIHGFKHLIVGRGVSPTHGAIIINRDCFKKLSYPEAMKGHHDFVMFAQMIALYKGCSISEPVVYKYKRRGSLRSDKKAIEVSLQKSPEILFDPSVLPVEFFKFKSLYIAKEYLRKARFHFKDNEFVEFRENFYKAVGVHKGSLLNPRFILRYLRSLYHSFSRKLKTVF